MQLRAARLAAALVLLVGMSRAVAAPTRALQQEDVDPLLIEGTFPVPADPADPRNRPETQTRRDAIEQQNAMDWPGPWGRARDEDAAVVGPLADEHHFSVIMIHGLGSSGYGWSDLMPGLDKLLPEGVRGRVKYVLPHAPSIPITFNLGYKMPAWFDVLALDGSRPEDAAGLAASRQKIESFIEQVAIPVCTRLFCGVGARGVCGLHAKACGSDARGVT